jgi:excinuclease ABC subunit C
MDERLAPKVERFPEGPGIYAFLDARGRTLYVGKAANLRARLKSYLRPGGDGRPLLRFLERRATDVEFVATRTEQEALLLENTVIKQRKPPCNIRLKDDKAFLLLRLDRGEPWPWFRLVRRRRDDGAEYFGPYATANAVRRTLRLLHKVVPLRDCADGVFAHRSRPCLKHQIGRCPAPCVGRIDRAAYDQHLDRAVAVLRGESAPLLRQLRAQMQAAAAALEFERAQALKVQCEALQRVAERQDVVGEGGDQDVLGLHQAGDQVTAVFLLYRGGRLETARRFTFRSELPEPLLLADLLGRFYEGDQFVPREVVVPGAVAEAPIVQEWLAGKRSGRVDLIVPERGARRRSVELAEENARMQDAASTDAGARAQAGAAELTRLLDLSGPPQRIHCLDVSTIHGRATVASRICFVDGKPDKSGYRRFKISAEHAGDDFRSLAEAVRRSLALCIERDDEPLPDLLLVDGGKGQLAAAQRALDELALRDQVPVAGLAKSRLRGLGAWRRRTAERLFVPGAPEPIALRDGAASTLLLAAARDEAHRFAISYHRKLRGRIESGLDAIPGVGAQRRRLLLAHFGSLQALRRATLAELRSVPGVPPAVAERVFRGLRAEA